MTQSLEIAPSMQRTDSIHPTRTVPLVSFVMPVYNVGPEIVGTISSAVKKFESLISSRFELILVDDGSTDVTRIFLDEIRDERVKIVGYSKNVGKGHALMFGFGFATADKVIFVDGDMHASVHDHKKYLDALDNADIVVSSKRVYGARITAGPKRNFLSLGFNLFVKILLPIDVSDTQAGFKAFKKAALNRILPLVSVKKYAFDVEILVVAKMLNMKIIELPAVVTLSDGFRKRDMLRMFVDLLGIAYRLRLKHWYHDNIVKRKSGPYKPIMKW